MTANDRPNARELTAAVRAFLEEEILPTLTDHRLRFRTLVAMNALSIVERESPLPEEPGDAERQLARRIRSGDVRDGDLEALREQVAARLRISSPAYLERYERSPAA